MSNRKVIVFKLRGQEYGLNIDKIRSIERLQQVTELPMSEAYMKGIINLRGQVIPVISLNEKFFQENDEVDEDTRMIIVPMDEGTEVGIIVDQATDVLDVDENQFQPNDSMQHAINKDFIDGVANINNRMLVLLNIEKVLSQKQEVPQYSVEA